MEVICYIILPKCDPVTKQVIHPCREMCQDLSEGCWMKLMNKLARMGSEFRENHWSWYLDFISSVDKVNLIDCDYLPSIHSSIPCFYKAVTCDSPPDVTNGTVILNTTQKDDYQLHDVVQYRCINDKFEMKEKSSITCLYSGQWSHSPPRCIAYLKNSLHPFLVILPIMSMSLIIYTSIAFYVWCHKRKVQNFKRNKVYDVFVCYCYEGQDPDFAEKIIPQELEEEYDLHLCIPRRDFKAGWDIKWNIMNAIRNSNSAIIIMSQDYINSLWCVEEFEDCYMENMKDPAFKFLLY